MPDTALLVIDVQQGLFDEDPPTINADGLAEKINDLTDRARKAGVLVVFIQDDRVGEGAADDIISGLNVADGDLRMRKRNCDSFHETDLQGMLGDAKRLVICGCQTDACIASTARRAVALGYEVDLASDAHSTSANPFMSAEKTIEFYNTWVLPEFGSDGFGNGKARISLKPAADIHY